ncbi:Alpha/Beta hydrolase protein [Mycena olivaceomarginata]|nr:Alpha/Beta hydrolase protein [Mycena olivaceomarginata]
MLIHFSFLLTLALPPFSAAVGSTAPPALQATAGISSGPPLRGANQSEDCLFVNKWRPAATLKEKLPILVYIHGGGYYSGSGSEWNGTSLVHRSIATRKPLFFVTFNYRLGVLGFIGSVQAPPSALNIGIQDQRDALRWIQDNAEAFGGNGSRITISGESAGGSSVHMHYLYPDSKRTFRAGISSSGTSLASPTPACEWHDRPGGAYNILVNATDCGTGAGSFECLQNLPFDTFWPLALTTYKTSGGFPPWTTCKGPRGSVIDEYPAKKVINGDFLNLPIITGTNQNEGNFLIGTTFLDITPQPALNRENSILSTFISGQASNFKTVSNTTISKLLALYGHPTQSLSNSTLYNRAAEIATDYAFLGSGTAFPEEVPEFLGAFHTADLYYLDIGFSPTPGFSQKLKSQMQDFYISFVNDLNPGAFWPKYTEALKFVMRLFDGSVGLIVDTERRAQTDILNEVGVMEEFGRLG